MKISVSWLFFFTHKVRITTVSSHMDGRHEKLGLLYYWVPLGVRMAVGTLWDNHV